MGSEKSSGRRDPGGDRPGAYYSLTGIGADGRETFASHGSTTGPWSSDAQHGGPPAALLGRALQRLPEAAGTVLGRFAMDILGPVPVGPLEVEARVLRPGRSVSLTEARMYDAAADRLVAVARGWHFPDRDDGPQPEAEQLPHRPEDGVPEEPPRSWHRGYLDSVEWSWIDGAVTRPGPGMVWMRPRVALVEGEEPDGLQRLLACVDSASGISAELDPDRWGFLNTELTVHLLRPPVGDWVCVDARTTLGPGSVGLAASTVHDEKGRVARTAQALLVAPR
ncbi:MAG TPA: thioesterase family protein [Marmoricola sp.]|nr:thioesterase family protein [Marmoricola sp.]